FFFLPALVAALTSADEFHSVTNTRWPLAVSHFASRLSCVVLPEPSMPSTTNSLPGSVWGVVSVSSIGRDVLGNGNGRRVGRHDPDGTVERGGQRGGVTAARPDF